MRPATIPSFIKQILGYTADQKAAFARDAYRALLKGDPEVSVVIPAYNEEENILNAVLSISRNTTLRSVEIIVVNNNSSDNTEKVALSAGITCINETKKGVKAARTAGLMAARGKYVMNADADTIYPPHWIDTMIPPLDDDKVAISYGKFAFLPSGGAGRLNYFLYEQMADALRWVKRNFKEEAVNAQCLQVDGYEHPPGTNEDGWLAIKLREKGFGKLHYVPDSRAIVWTVDRHLQNDGGLLKALIMRVKGAF